MLPAFSHNILCIIIFCLVLPCIFRYAKLQNASLKVGGDTVPTWSGSQDHKATSLSMKLVNACSAAWRIGGASTLSQFLMSRDLCLHSRTRPGPTWLTETPLTLVPSWTTCAMASWLWTRTWRRKVTPQGCNDHRSFTYVCRKNRSVTCGWGNSEYVACGCNNQSHRSKLQQSQSHYIGIFFSFAIITDLNYTLPGQRSTGKGAAVSWIQKARMYGIAQRATVNGTEGAVKRCLCLLYFCVCCTLTYWHWVCEI